ncbi:hypothetical protein FLM48_20615 [Shewanella sp. Scap07]|uniref:hypothetical protein n=1 Tax=Shewanella sp. Scap07 TaxID=2589987 RepID=UPI0015BA3DAF|nr:hypothetical protein [Shewanella sp. Scap07]QLE87262.1 hypothetical protein FLM48_20615 [Shewanella sp. Scap07]
MAYELRDFDGQPVEFYQLNEKSFACAHGETQEELFVSAFARMQSCGYISDKSSIAVHPEKETNPYHPDLLIDGSLVGELKAKASPLFMAGTYGIDPQYALTMDLKDSFHYSKYLQKGIDVTIFIWVKWAAKSMCTFSKGSSRDYPSRTYEVKQLAGIWKVKFSDLRRFELESSVPIHWYKESFRQPPKYSLGDPNHKEWTQALIEFEPRLVEGNLVKSIASKGYTKQIDGEMYTAGDSSGSYVFDLRNPIFECLYTNARTKT